MKICKECGLSDADYNRLKAENNRLRILILELLASLGTSVEDIKTVMMEVSK